MTDVMTVAGPVASSSLGPTLPHEHIFVNLMDEFRGTGLLNDYDLMVEEVRRFVNVGGRTIVDVTPPELTHGASPDPGAGLSDARVDPGSASVRDVSNLRALRQLAQDVGINLIIGTGHYRDPYLDRDWFGRRSVDQVAEMMVRDATEGVAGTEMRAGIIGEVGSNLWYISELEERSFRAAARAHRATGLAITTHANRWPVGIAQLELLGSEQVDPRRVIVGHSDSVYAPGYQRALAEAGAFVEFDHCRGLSSREASRTVEMVMELARGGHLDQVLISSDICLTPHLFDNGGGGYAYVPTVFKDMLLTAGLSEEEFECIQVDNPRRALTGQG